MGRHEETRQGVSSESKLDSYPMKEWKDQPSTNGRALTTDSFSDQADDELSTTSGSLLSAPASPLLPQFMISSKLSSRWVTQPASIVVLASITYMISSTVSGIENRWNMYHATYKFPYPLTILVLQLLFTEFSLLVVVLLVRQLHRLVSRQVSVSSSDTKCARPFEISLTVSFLEIWEHFPLIISFLTAHCAALVCLLYVPINRYVIYTAPMLLVQYVLSRLASPKDQLSGQTSLACVFVMVGYLLVVASATPAVHGMTGYHITGTFTGLIAAFAFPIYYSLLAKTITAGNCGAVRLLHILNCSSILLIMPLLVLTGEIFKLMSHCYFLDVRGFWFMMFILSSVTALASSASFVLLAYISPLSFMVLCYTRTALIMAPFSSWMNKDTFGIFHTIGWLLSLASLFAYIHFIRASKI